MVLTIEHDSILNHLEEHDGLFISQRCYDLWGKLNNKNIRKLSFEIAPRRFYHPSMERSSNKSGDRSLLRLLNLCNQRKWKTVGTTAFGENDHYGFLKILQQWPYDYPEKIRIFHLNKNDFAWLKLELNQINRGEDN
jgi:hypothetical protein